MIEIENLSKWYGAFRVLAECSTAVAKGEVVVVCGPSGSGKSTLIKCVNGLEPFQQGRITASTEPTSSGSSAEVGSSNSMRRGCIASARAMATRCCWPPERRDG